MSELASTRVKTASDATKDKSSGGAPADRPASQPAKKKGRAGVAKETDLKAKEEEYRRLNEALQAKTASLLKEADSFIMRDTEGLFENVSPSRGHPSPSTGSPAVHTGGGGVSLKGGPVQGKKGNTPRAVTAAGGERRETSGQSKGIERPRTSGQERMAAKTVSSKPPRSVKSQGGGRRGASNMGVGMQDELGMGPEQDNIVDLLNAPDGDFHSRIHSSGIGSVTAPSFPRADFPDVFATSSLRAGQGESLHDDIMPEVAEELGPEAMIRFLKAKLRVMQEEMDRMNGEAKEKDKLLQETQSRLSELTSEQGRWRKTQQGLQTQSDRQRQLAEELKRNNDHLEGQISSLKKELDAKERAQKQTVANQSVIEVRLNRALEEVEKNRIALQRARAESKDLSEQDRRKMEKALADNKRLEKQKGELVTAFKKQLKLIDILKRQKMHLEAAKLLSFSEEEFVKALDWELP